MSIETWKEQYFKIDTSSWKAATLVSIVKWEGLSPSNLAIHDLTKEDGSARIEQPDNDDCFFVTGQNCSLCILAEQKEIENTGDINDNHCDYCPLAKHLGRPCDEDTDLEDGPYCRFFDNGEIQPMLAALRGTLQYLEATSGTLADFEDLEDE